MEAADQAVEAAEAIVDESKPASEPATAAAAAPQPPKEVPKIQETADVSTPKLPPRPADYDYYWYEDEDGNWRNEYDDMGYEFDPER